MECSRCHSARHLAIESSQGLNPTIAGSVAVEYSCGRYQAIHAREASVEAVAKVLTNSNMAAGVLKIGRPYIHCGLPMERVDSLPPNLMAQGPSEQDSAMIAWRPAQLQCRCGFRIAVPL